MKSKPKRRGTRLRIHRLNAVPAQPDRGGELGRVRTHCVHSHHRTSRRRGSTGVRRQRGKDSSDGIRYATCADERVCPGSFRWVCGSFRGVRKSKRSMHLPGPQHPSIGLVRQACSRCFATCLLHKAKSSAQRSPYQTGPVKLGGGSERPKYIVRLT